ncbi:MAG: DUF3048 domain-containing protein [Patescibacteria group bacterium]
MANKHKHKKELLKRKHTTLLLTGAGVVALAFLVIIQCVWQVFPFQKSPTQTPSEAHAAETTFRHPLTGLPVDKKMDLPQVYGVMVDNHQDAWPQSGIDKAFLVYEAPVEGGITRLLAFFSDDQTVEKIGPVRSARPYFLDWNNELDALYAHVGGSNAALAQIASGGTLDLNQYWNGSVFWRATNQPAPHNVYISTDKMHTAFEEQKKARSLAAPLYETWTFKATQPNNEPDTKKIILSFDSASYNVQWDFDEQTDRYTRSHNGSAHITQDGSKIFADNIAVIVTEVEVLDAVGRRQVRTTGEGTVFVFQDGKKIEAVWKKPSETQRVRFFDLQGNEIAFNPGVTWIEVLSDLSLLTTK